MSLQFNGPVLASIFVPGLGQFLLKRRGQSLAIFLTTLSLVLLIQWAFERLKIGSVALGGFTTSWLWLPLGLFWLWNILHTQALAAGRRFNLLPLILSGALIVYVIAWSVTDIKPERLITRFDDARKVATNLLNPDMLTFTANGQEQICAWSCLVSIAGNQLSGKPLGGELKWSENLLDIIGRVKPVTSPAWQIRLGWAQAGVKVDTFVAGTMLETIAMGLMATLFSLVLAVPLSFLAARNIMERIPGGVAIYYFVRGVLNAFRAVDTIVWGLLVIVWVGLGNFAGVLALTIHSVASLAKLFSEEIEHIDPGPVEAVTATGAGLIQTLRFAVIPQVIPSFLSYLLLRWDINMRSATVVGFVAGGGIGFFVVETTRQGAYQQYATALWVVAIVIVLVDWISTRWRARILEDQPLAKTGGNLWRNAFYAVLGLAVFVYCWNVAEISIVDLLSPGKNFGKLLLDFVSIDLSQSVLTGVFQQMLVTVFQALLATTLGAILALPVSFFAARNLRGDNIVSRALYHITRGLFNVLRSIEALLYVVIFVFWVGIGPFAGMLALAVTSFALIGKLFADAIENIEPGPIEAVTATGANPLQVVVYAVLPQIVPPFVAYLIYQWDINIRMATIIGFAGGGGIGLTLTTYFGSLQYHKAGTVVLFIVVVVALMDFLSAKIRHELV